MFARATIQFVAEAQDWQAVGCAVRRLHLLVSCGAAFLLWLSAPFLAGFFHEETLNLYLRLFAFDIPLFSLAHAYRNILIGKGHFRERALSTAGRWTARLLFIILLVELGFSVPGAIAGSILASVVEMLMGHFYVRLPLFQQTSFPLRELCVYSVPLFLFAVSLRLFSHMDLFLLKALGGSAELAGIYGAAQNLSLVPGIFSMSFAPLLLSTLSRMQRFEGEFCAKEMGRNAMRLIVGLLPFASMAAGASSEIIGFIFGPAFFPSAPLLAVLIFGALAVTMISVTTAILTAAHRPGWTFALTGPLVPLATVGHLLLIPRMGPMGAALVTTFLAGAGALAGMLCVYRLWRILPPQATFLRSGLISVLAYALAHFWLAFGFFIFIKLLAITVVIGLSFLWMGEFKNEAEPALLLNHHPDL